jgi:hypothetical protein
MTSSGMSQRAKSPTKTPQAQAMAPLARLQQRALGTRPLSLLAQPALSLTGNEHQHLGFGSKHRIHLLSRNVVARRVLNLPLLCGHVLDHAGANHRSNCRMNFPVNPVPPLHDRVLAILARARPWNWVHLLLKLGNILFVETARNNEGDPVGRPRIGLV